MFVIPILGTILGGFIGYNSEYPFKNHRWISVVLGAILGLDTSAALTLFILMMIGKW